MLDQALGRPFELSVGDRRPFAVALSLPEVHGRAAAGCGWAEAAGCARFEKRALLLTAAVPRSSADVVLRGRLNVGIGWAGARGGLAAAG